MEGFYAVYYTGPAGHAAFGLVLKGGKVVGVDPSGGDLVGAYEKTESGGLSLSIGFSFEPGTVLVTGQTLPNGGKFGATLNILKETLEGAPQLLDLPFGRVNAKFEKKLDL